MTTLVTQRNTSDCTICCLAMALDLPYELVLAVGLSSGSFTEGQGTKDTDEIIEKLGLVEYSSYKPSIPGDFQTIYCPGMITKEYFRGQVWGRRALLAVPSLNKPGGSHHVYYDGTELFDPSTQKTYTSLNDLLPAYITVFREGASAPQAIRDAAN